MIVETAIGIVIATITMIAVAQLVALLARQRDEIAQMHLATHETANIMERVMRLPWDELTAEAVAAIALSPEVTKGLTEPELAISVQPQEGPVLAKEVEIKLTWQDRSGRRVQPLQLVAWKYPHDSINPEAE